MEIKTEVPLLLKVAFVLIIVGFLLLNVGFWTFYWTQTDQLGNANEGLWWGCYNSECWRIHEFAPLPREEISLLDI